MVSKQKKKGKTMELREVIKKLETAPGYMLAVTFMDKKGKLDHTMITEKFNTSDMFIHLNNIKKLVDAEIERLSNEVED